MHSAKSSFCHLESPRSRAKFPRPYHKVKQRIRFVVYIIACMHAFYVCMYLYIETSRHVQIYWISAYMCMPYWRGLALKLHWSECAGKTSVVCLHTLCVCHICMCVCVYIYIYIYTHTQTRIPHTYIQTYIRQYHVQARAGYRSPSPGGHPYRGLPMCRNKV